MIKLLRYWSPLAMYMGLIYAQSSYVPPEGMPDFAPFDKLAHVIIYAVLGALFLRAYLSLTNGGFDLRWAFISVASAIVYGLTDEWHQSMVPGRAPEMLDLVADGFGAIAGVFIYGYRYQHQPPRTAAGPD